MTETGYFGLFGASETGQRRELLERQKFQIG